MVGVSNSGPLMWLPRVGCFSLMERIFSGGLFIPQAVHHEVVVQGGERPGVKEVRDAVTLNRIKLVQGFDRAESAMLLTLKRDLDAGEAEAIVLAHRIRPDRILLDERRAREWAKRLGFRPLGTLGVLLQAKSWGWIPSVKPLIEEMTRLGFWLSRETYEEVLRSAGEGWKPGPK